MKKDSSKLVPLISLFLSSSTLICCALPAALVTIGAGATLLSLTSSFPFIIALSRYKKILFIVAGAALLLTALIRKKGNTKSCPIGETQAACQSLNRFNDIIFYLSLALYSIGFFFAFIAAHLR